MKKLVLALALVAVSGSFAYKVYAAENGVKKELRDDDKKKRKKKKKGCCAATEQKKCCSSGTQKSGCSEKH